MGDWLSAAATVVGLLLLDAAGVACSAALPAPCNRHQRRRR